MSKLKLLAPVLVHESIMQERLHFFISCILILSFTLPGLWKFNPMIIGFFPTSRAGQMPGSLVWHKVPGISLNLSSGSVPSWVPAGHPAHYLENFKAQLVLWNRSERVEVKCNEHKLIFQQRVLAISGCCNEIPQSG